MNRYRLMWNETRYTPGEVKIVAYDDNDNIAATESIHTAGKAHHLLLSANRTELEANGDDLAYITVQVADKDGNIVPTDNRLVKFETSGAGQFEATANGDATCLLPFQKPEMQLFSGAATAIVRSSDKPGTITFRAKAAGVKAASITITVK
jgi:beta-galactosidase